MLILGHAGITLGAAVLLNRALAKGSFPSTRKNKGRECLQPSPETPPTQNYPSRSRASWFISLGNRVDLRPLLVGSLLPDIIDKPVGQLLFRDIFSSGRIFCHTLLFLILAVLAGVYLYRSWKKLWLLILSFGIFTHLIFDQMWRTPRTLLWPLYGFTFEKSRSTYLMQSILQALLSDPGTYISELLGTAILIWFTLVLLRRGKVYTFIRKGQV